MRAQSCIIYKCRLVNNRQMQGCFAVPCGDGGIGIFGRIGGKGLRIQQGRTDRKIWHPHLVHAVHGKENGPVQAFGMVALGIPFP